MSNRTVTGSFLRALPALLIFAVLGVILTDLHNGKAAAKRWQAQVDANYRESQTPEGKAARKQPKVLTADASPY